MLRILVLIITFISISCKPANKLKQEIPTPIAASRVMFLVMPMKEVGIPLGSFFGVCDSVFNKNNIVKAAVTLSPDDFDESKHLVDPISKPYDNLSPIVSFFLCHKN